jgi:hypothetical protein
MASYTVNLTDTENNALSVYVISQQEWIDNVVHDRCRIATDDVCKICVEKCLETGTPIPGTKDGMVALAFQMGWVKTAEQQNAESDARRRADEEAALAASQPTPPAA